MCGRFTLRSRAVEVAEHFRLFDVPALTPRFNIVPSQSVVAIVNDGDRRIARSFNWGLVPEWLENPEEGTKPINARGESAAEKPYFRLALRRRRCLIPADGFYEWQADGRERQPFHFRLRNGAMFAFAGLYEEWRSPERSIDTCTIMTIAANSMFRQFHERMPVILPPADYAGWLNPRSDLAADIQPLLKAYPAEQMHFWPVAKRANSPKVDDDACVRPFRERRLFD